jgi:hypothetical protein
LSATISQYFIGGMMPELASLVQQPQTIIEIRPYRGGWSVTKERTFNRTGLATTQKSTQSTIAKAGAKLDTVKLGC